MTFFLIYAATMAALLTVLAVLTAYKRYQTAKIVKILENLESSDIIFPDFEGKKEDDPKVH